MTPKIINFTTQTICDIPPSGIIFMVEEECRLYPSHQLHRPPCSIEVHRICQPKVTCSSGIPFPSTSPNTFYIVEPEVFDVLASQGRQHDVLMRHPTKLNSLVCYIAMRGM